MKNFFNSPHKEAPMMVGQDLSLLIRQALQEMKNLQQVESVRQLFRQLGFVNLWMFGKIIAGYNGPFDEINDELHLDMANFCQKYASVPGARVAVFAPRWHFKTSVCTILHNTWLLLRNPEGTIGQSHAKVDDAKDIMHLTQRTFDSNEFFAWLYPEYVPQPNQKRWNDNEMYLPPTVKRRWTKEASLECISAGGTSQGKHFSIKVDLDDIVGEQDLGAGRESSIEMLKKRNWIDDVQRSLVTRPDQTIVFLKATRYGMDDSYAGIEADMGQLIGYDAEKLADYECKPHGKWTVYWRFVKENGRIIFPERVTQEWLDDLKEENPWFYWTQMENRPQKSALSELSEFKVPSCKLLYDDDKGYEVEFNPKDRVSLELADVVQATDPAATEDKITAKISRTANVVLAHFPDDRRVILHVDVGYVGQQKMYDWMFRVARQYKGYLRRTYLEALGAFKLLVNPLRERERVDNFMLSLTPLDRITGKKGVKIRNALLPLVEKGLLYINKDCRDQFDEEYRRFSGQDLKVDILDATSMCIQGTTRPLSEDELVAKRNVYHKRMMEVSSRTGY